MKEILKPIFEWIVDQYELFENPIYNWLVALIIGAIGFAIAWNFVGKLYADGDISSSIAGSMIHWIVRLVAVLAMYLLVATIICIIKLILAVPWWGWIIVIGVILAIGILSIVLKRRNGGI